LLLLPGIGWAGSYASIFVVYCLLQVATNIAQGPYQAFIPELLPKEKHGRASGVKGLLEVGGGLLLVYFTSLFIDRYAAGGGSYLLWTVLGVLMAVIFITLAATILRVKEPRVPAGHAGIAFAGDDIQPLSEGHLAEPQLRLVPALPPAHLHGLHHIQQFALYYFRMSSAWSTLPMRLSASRSSQWRGCCWWSGRPAISPTGSAAGL
jgi:Na+/melibiose symporter-like transporter